MREMREREKIKMSNPLKMNKALKNKYINSLNANCCKNTDNPADGGRRPQCESSTRHFDAVSPCGNYLHDAP